MDEMEQIQHDTPEERQTHGEHPGEEKGFFVVGLGASAGGIAALKQFFCLMPSDSGMAFVVVLHLSQEHESHLAQILQTNTVMPVTQVTETLKVEPNHVYVIPPAKHLAMVDGEIRLQEPERVRGRRVPIDLFFRTLGDAYGNHAVAVILSGTGSDGTLGIKCVKENGGIVLAQSPNDAEFDEMPGNAVNTKLVDVVLPISELPEKILAIGEVAKRLEPLAETADVDIEEDTTVPEEEAKIKLPTDPLREILTVLKVRTGHDFSNYKRPTLLRRIARRLQVHELTETESYLNLLRENADEVQALLRDLLISVTNFFRDKEAFDALEQDIIPRLFIGKTSNDTVRVWSCGCATGEEAYSLAMLLSEYAFKQNDAPKIQIFASDISEEAIRTAREGRYDESLVADISPERLRRFFVKDDKGYRVKKEIRDLVLFAPHNVLRDPPFSRLALITCRNLLIYLNRETQEKIFEVFHFALRPNRFLFLGSSESAESVTNLFNILDKKNRLYQYRAVPTAYSTLPMMPLPGKWEVKNVVDLKPLEQAASFGDLHFRLVEKLAPPSVLIDENYDIVHLSESAGRFLQMVGGQPTHDLLKVIHPSLRLDLRSVLLEARQTGGPSEARNVRFADGEDILLTLRVHAVKTSETAQGFYLVIFDTARTPTAPAKSPETLEPAPGRDAVTSVVGHLEEDLSRTRDQLRTTIEQHETSVEELRASNEELQAINEELRSASEELETSKEELQSVNEELTTVNYELKEKVDDLSRANSDLQNLMASTDIGTMFLDRSLHIKFYTPSVGDLFNIIPSDVERPLAHLTHKLDYPNLSNDASEVVRTLQTVEREVKANDRHYLVRLTPYRTVEDRIEGVVISFVDVSELTRTTTALSVSERRLEQQTRTFNTALAALPDFVYIFDKDGRFMYSNRPLLKLLGVALDDIIGKNFFDLNYPDELAARLQGQIQHVLTTGETVRDETPFTSPKGEEGFYEYIFSPVLAPDGSVELVAGSTRDVTERNRTEQALRAKEAELDTIINHTPFMLTRCTRDLRYRFVSPAYAAMIHRKPEDIAGKPIIEIMGEEGFKTIAPHVERVLQGERVEYENEVDFRSDGHPYLHVVYTPDRDEAGNVVGWFASLVDITERKLAEEALRASQQALQEADKRKDEFLAVLAHELRNPLSPIRTSLEIMKRTKDEEIVKEARAVIERQVSHMVRLVDDLLDISRITRGKIALQKERLALSEVIDMAVEITRPFIEENKHELTVSLPAEKVWLNADKMRLSQVFLNLLNNAAKYTDPGGKISLTAELEKNSVVVRIKDTGLGIPPEELANMFELFTRLERDAGQDGLGIGLSLVKQLVEMHGGTIEAYSAGLNQGSEFTVRLPVVKNVASTNIAPKEITPTNVIERDEPTREVKQQNEKNANARRVLVIDDYEPNRKTIARLLRLMGHEVMTATGGEEGLGMVLEFRPEIILLDINMPVMNGYEVARRLREDSESIKIKLVALTGYGQEEDIQSAKEAGFDFHLVKPVDIEKLEKMMLAEP